MYILLIFASDNDNKCGLYPFWYKLETKKIGKVNMTYKCIGIKQHLNVTYLGCMLESMSVRWINSF